MNDDRLQKALDIANYRVTLDNQRRLLKEKYNNQLRFSFEGSEFISSLTLIGGIETMLNNEWTDGIIEDARGMPAKVSSLREFLDLALSTYAEASNEYYVHWQSLRKARNVDSATK